MFAKVGVTGVDSNLATAIWTIVILLFTWCLFLFSGNPRSLASLTQRNWIFLILSGLLTGLSWLCYFRALQLGQASQVAPIDNLSVVFAIGFATIFLHEKTTWHHRAGGAFICISAVILTRVV